MKSPILVLTTVNASYSKKLDAQGLVDCLLEPSLAQAACGPMSSFFGEVKPELQVAFAEMHGVTKAQLVAAAKTFAEFSGQSYPLSPSTNPDSTAGRVERFAATDLASPILLFD